MKTINMDAIKTRAGEIASRLASPKNQWILNIVIIVLINLVGILLYFRLDLTRNGAYSLSRISREVVSSLESPLIVKVFFSKDLPAPYNSVSRYLADLMEEYDQYGNRNFRYEFMEVDEQKNAASDYGVRPVQIREIKNDRMSTRNAFMGLAIVHGDLIEKIDSITEPEGVEYRITTLIQKMNGKIDSLLRLEKPVTVTLYASSILPISGMENLEKRVSDIVQKENERNYGKLEFRYVDPVQDPRALETADIYGLPKLKWPVFTSMEGKSVGPGEGMIGIVVEHESGFQTIQMLSRTIFGQYAVSELDSLPDRLNSAIDALISINPKVGYITGHGERDLNNDRDGAAAFRELVSDMYDFKVIDLTKEEIGADIQTIIVNGPRSEYTEEELFKIDQHLMSGRSALFFIDSFTEMQPEGQNMFMREPMVLPVNTGLDRLIAHYGVTVNRDIVLDQNSYRTNLRGFGEQNLYFAPLIDKAGLSEDSEITRYLRRVVFLKGSSLTLSPRSGAGWKGMPLVQSSPLSWLMKGRISFMPWGMNPPPASQMQKQTLSALVSGELSSYFAGSGAPAPAQKALRDQKSASPVTSQSLLKKTVKPARIIVVGTSEITTPNVVDKEGKSPNAVLLHNMIDYLNGNFSIPEMRSKGLELNPLKDSGETTKLMLKVFNIAVVPLLVVIAGIVAWRFRAVRRKRIMEEFAKEGAGE